MKSLIFEKNIKIVLITIIINSPYRNIESCHHKIMEITLCLKHGKEELENKVNPISETISPVVMSTSSKVNHYHIKQCLTEVYQPLSHLPILKLLDSSDTSAVWFHSSWKNIKCILYQFIQVYIALIHFKLKFSSPIISVNTLP